MSLEPHTANKKGAPVVRQIAISHAAQFRALCVCMPLPTHRNTCLRPRDSPRHPTQQQSCCAPGCRQLLAVAAHTALQPRQPACTLRQTVGRPKQGHAPVAHHAPLLTHTAATLTHTDCSNPATHTHTAANLTHTHSTSHRRSLGAASSKVPLCKPHHHLPTPQPEVIFSILICVCCPRDGA